MSVVFIVASLVLLCFETGSHCASQTGGPHVPPSSVSERGEVIHMGLSLCLDF